MGQSAGIVNSIDPIRDIVERIVNDAENCLKNAYSSIK